MRKLFLFTMLALSACAFISCNKEVDDEGLENQGKTVHFTINTNAPETKSYITYDSGTKKYTPGWHNGDQLGVMFDSWSADDPLNATFTNTAATGVSASFSGTGTVKATEQTIYAFYPASAFAKAYASKVIGLTIPATQKPTATSFDKNADLLVNKAYPITIDNASVTIDDMQFTRILSTLKITVSDGTAGSDLDGDEITAITLESTMAGAALTGRYQWSYTSETGEMNGTVYSNKVSADLSDNPISLDGSSPIYLMVNPTTLTSGSKLNITISTNNHEISKEATLPKDFVFPAGGVAQLSISIKDTDTIGAAIVEPTGTGWFLVQKASWLKAGDKIVISNLASNGALGAASGSIRTKVAVSVTDGKLNIGEATQLTLATGNASGSWAIKEGDNYLYHSGDKSVGTKATLDDSGSWNLTVTPSASTIRNVGASTYYLQYNTSSPRFTTYTGTQQDVLIYKQYIQPELAALNITVVPDHENKTITVTWTDVSNATNYAVECTGQSTQNIAPGVQTAVFDTGLSYGTEYTITVTASAAGYVSSSDSDAVTLVDPAAKTITRLKASITGVAAVGVSDAVETGVYSLTNATDGDLTVTPDGTVVTAASASSGSVTYTVANNTGDARNGSISIEVEGGNTIVLTVSQLAGIKYYTKVTNAASLAAEDKLIFVYESDNVAMSTTQNTNNRGQQAVTITASGINANTLSASVQVITLKGSSGAWEFYTGSGYLYSPSASNYLRTQASNDNYGKWTISISSGNASINCNGRTAYYLQYNGSSDIFSCYKNTQNNIQIYRLTN